uniref:Uncharacterized protein n=1 Tax=Anguilla anguilla TaxID=7936 RepID=A0A0E9RXG5_ANGAN
MQNYTKHVTYMVPMNLTVSHKTTFPQVIVFANSQRWTLRLEHIQMYGTR